MIWALIGCSFLAAAGVDLLAEGTGSLSTTLNTITLVLAGLTSFVMAGWQLHHRALAVPADNEALFDRGERLLSMAFDHHRAARLTRGAVLILLLLIAAAQGWRCWTDCIPATPTPVAQEVGGGPRLPLDADAPNGAALSSATA